MYTVLGYVYLTVVPGWLGSEGTALNISMWSMARSVLIFLGVPLLAGFLTRHYLARMKGDVWYEQRFLPRLGPSALIGLLFTIVMMFALKGEVILDAPLDVGRIALPLLTVVADAIGLAAGAVLCKFLLDMSLIQYLTEMKSAIGPTTFWVGVIKAPVFALLIALSACYRGLQVRDSSRELGRLTTVAVVQSIFLVILADAIFAVAFWQLDI